MDEISFQVSEETPASMVPVINGCTLIDLVTEFEVTRNHDPHGGYGGLVPAFFNFGDLRTYLLGLDNHEWPRPGTAWLLGCDCGEVGCWPLEATVDTRPTHVMWSNFSQPFRPGRGFGPFVFDRDQYATAVADAVALLGVRGSEV